MSSKNNANGRTTKLFIDGAKVPTLQRVPSTGTSTKGANVPAMQIVTTKPSGSGQNSQGGKSNKG